jgi:hypothetical protein
MPAALYYLYPPHLRDMLLATVHQTASPVLGQTLLLLADSESSDSVLLRAYELLQKMDHWSAPL